MTAAAVGNSGNHKPFHQAHLLSSASDDQKQTSLRLWPSFRYSNRRAKRLTIYITGLNHMVILTVAVIEDVFSGNDLRKNEY